VNHPRPFPAPVVIDPDPDPAREPPLDRLPVGAQVYVVDGDFAVARGLESMLRAYRLRVRTFPSAEGLLAALEGDPAAGTEGPTAEPAPADAAPVCLITELGLPGMSGLDLITRLRRRGSRLPVIVMANRTDVSSAVAAMRAGALDYLEKPFSQQRLLARVAEALSGHGVRQEGAAFV
jgi:two-component system response regulator DctR